MEEIFTVFLQTRHSHSSVSPTTLQSTHCLHLPLSLHLILLSARPQKYFPDQAVIWSRLLWSLHHSYWAVGTGNKDEGKNEEEGEKSDGWNVGQWRCAWGSFSLRFPSVSLPPWATTKLAKKDEGWKCLSPTPAALQLTSRRRTELLMRSLSHDRRWTWCVMLTEADRSGSFQRTQWRHKLLYSCDRVV